MKSLILIGSLCFLAGIVLTLIAFLSFFGVFGSTREFTDQLTLSAFFGAGAAAALVGSILAFSAQAYIGSRNLRP